MHPTTTRRRYLIALFRFHAGGGGRVASRNGVLAICAILVVIGSAPDPLILFIRSLALGLAGTGAGSGPLVALTAIAYGLASDAAPRLTLGLGGWMRSLPVDGVRHRRGVAAALAIVQIPLAAAVVIAALLTVAVFGQSLSWAKLLGAAVALAAAGVAAVPTRRAYLATPLAVAAGLLASLGRWPALALGILLLIASDRVAGALRFPTRRQAVPAPAAPGALRMFRFTWRAVGWRMLAPLPIALVALAAAWFYTRNNELAGAELGFVARLWSIIAVALYIGGLGDIVARRRPAWPWLRSLPWSSTARAIDDALALAIPALAIACAAIVVDPRAALVALMIAPPLAALGAGALPRARRRLTRTSGRVVTVGVLLGTACAYWPWAAGIALLATPLLLRAAAHRERREIVTGWTELYHDAVGDTLAWSAQ